MSEHGSWNRDPLNGYEVVYVPFQNGCPVGVALDKTEALLIADESATSPGASAPQAQRRLSRRGD